MRRVKRLTLDRRTHGYLRKKQTQANTKQTAGTLNSTEFWKSARQTKTLNDVLNVLQQMMGERQRCMYCLDSHGSDIEHFRPKADYPKRMFNWRNLLLCCTECGRIKGNQFPLQGNKPLLIDPTKEQPWRYLDFDPTTGNLVARFDPQTDQYFSKGEITVDTLHLDRREALAAGYKKTFNRLAETVTTFLNMPGDADDLIVKLREQDDHGLLGWVFVSTGKTITPFSDLHQSQPEIWSICQTAFSD